MLAGKMTSSEKQNLCDAIRSGTAAGMKNMDIDMVVKYLILTLVLVFDPLAICLVIATSDSLAQRRKLKENPAMSRTMPSRPAQATEAPGDVIQMRFADTNDKNAV